MVPATGGTIPIPDALGLNGAGGAIPDAVGLLGGGAAGTTIPGLDDCGE